MANGFAQAGDFFARAMQKQEQAASWQTKAQLPTITNFAGIEQNSPDSSTFNSGAPATLPSLEAAATGSSLRQSPEIVSELLAKAKAKREQSAFNDSDMPAPPQPTNGYTPEISTVGARVTPSVRGQRIAPRPGRSVRAGQISA